MGKRGETMFHRGVGKAARVGGLGGGVALMSLFISICNKKGIFVNMRYFSTSLSIRLSFR